MHDAETRCEGARKSVVAARARYETAKARADKIAAQLAKIEAAAKTADRRDEVAMKINLGALMLLWAERDARFAAYCLAGLSDEPLSPRATRLLAGVSERFRNWSSSIDEHGGGSDA